MVTPSFSVGSVRTHSVIAVGFPASAVFREHDYLLHLNQPIIKISQAFDDGSNLSRKSDTFLFFLQLRLFKYRSNAFSESVEGFKPI